MTGCCCEDSRRAARADKVTQAVRAPCRSRRSSSTRRESATAATSARASAQAAQPPAQRAAAATPPPAAPAPAAAPGHAARPGAAASAASTSRIASSVAANSCARARRWWGAACGVRRARLARLPRCCKEGGMLTCVARFSHREPPVDAHNAKGHRAPLGGAVRAQAAGPRRVTPLDWTEVLLPEARRHQVDAPLTEIMHGCTRQNATPQHISRSSLAPGTRGSPATRARWLRRPAARPARASARLPGRPAAPPPPALGLTA